SPRGPQLLGLDLVAYEDLHFGGLLGRGGEAPVYAAWYRDTPVAVKVFGEAAAGARELGMYLKAGSHDNVVALRGVCGHAGAMYLLLEYCPRGTLDVALHFSSGARWDARKMVPIVRSVARGMHHLHTRGLLHRDIKPGNIFVGHGQMMKLGDLGMAREVPLSQPAAAGGALRRLSPGVVGTPQYAAPEILLDRPTPVGMEFGEAALRADVWSFGVTLWEILERRRPFDKGGKAAAAVVSGGHHPRLPPVSAGHHSEPAAQLRIRRELAALVEACTREDPRERLTSADVLQRLRAVGRIAGGRQEV
ncbi:protein kinase, partial [Helicosporidium sp. ATCC 50920]